LAALTTGTNIVLILADDLGFSDIGCFGSEIATPNLDALATKGLRVTQMYNGARCCPTRASLLTGLYPHQAGVGHMVLDLGPPTYQGFLNDRCVTLAEVLGRTGYRTVISGKWHLAGPHGAASAEGERGELDGRTPLQRGFDRYFGTLGGAGSYFNPHGLMRDGETVEPEKPCDGPFYYTDAIGRYAADQIDAAASQHLPFFVYVAYTAPHFPLHALPDDVASHRGRYRLGWDAVRESRQRRLIELGINVGRWKLSPRDPAAPAWDSLPPDRQVWEDARMAVYAAQVASMDRSVGEIVDALERNGVLDNTLLLFMSDNGGCAQELREDGPYWGARTETSEGRSVRLGNHRDITPGPADTYMSYGLPWANATNTPFRLFKNWSHEGGISTPFIAHWPAVVPPGGLSHAVCHMTDIMPTCLDAAGVQYPATWNDVALPRAEGESLMPLLGGDVVWSRSRPIFWEHEGNCAVRDGRWKLVRKFSAAWELYDMELDRTELHDLASDQPELVGELADAFGAWAHRCGVRPWEELLPNVPSRAPIG
jgi:arylsulfatase